MKLSHVFHCFIKLIKRNELSSHEKTQRTLQCTLLSERSESEKVTHRVTKLFDIIKKGKTWEAGKGPAVARGCGGGEG